MKNNQCVKRIAYLLLALLTVFALAACRKPADKHPASDEGAGTGSGPVKDTDAGTDEYGQDIVENDLPSGLNYNGETITFVTRPRDAWVKEFELNLTAADRDDVDNAVFKRNRLVEQTLNVSFKFTTNQALTVTGGSSGLTNFVYSNWLAGQHIFDVVVANAFFMTNNGVRQCFVNLYNDSKVPYLNLEKPYWNQNYINSASVNDSLYYIIGDINLSVWNQTIVVFANMTQLEQLEEADILDTVLAGNGAAGGWTLEEMERIMAMMPYQEMDNIDGVTAGDKFALHSQWASVGVDGFQAAFGITLLEKSDESTYSLNVTGNERLSNGVTAVYKLYQNENAYLTTTSGDIAFYDGRALFEINSLNGDPDELAQLIDMLDKYVILPLPKLDNVQMEYGALPQDSYNLMAIADINGMNHEMISAVLEMMCSESYKTVRPKYIETFIKGRYMKEEKNSQVMDIIFDSVVFDPGIIYSCALRPDDNSPALQHAVWRGTTRSGRDPFTVYEGIKTTVETSLTDLLTWFMTH